jgi:hypothetical protein
VLLLLLVPAPAIGQTASSIVGRVLAAGTTDPVAGVTVSVVGTTLSAQTGADGRFLIGNVPAGERSVRAERIGYRPVVVEQVLVPLGRPAVVPISLEPDPVPVAGVSVDARRVRLIEPEVSTTRQVVLGREVRDLPVDRVEEVVELTPGVSGGHFRGGRIGQEVLVLDGLELKNPLEASRTGSGLELPPSALEQVEVLTGGLGASTGSALSGVISYVTRRGNADAWRGTVGASTDQWAPAALFHGFTGLSVSADGPLRRLGQGTTLAFDAVAQGLLDADPRARGLACLEPGDADDALAAEIRSLAARAPALRCPWTADNLPNQQGDRVLAFARLDATPARDLALTVSLLGNRMQRQLYTPEFRYHADGQLGQRSVSGLASAALAWSRIDQETIRRATLRVALLHLDRYLGALEPGGFDGSGIAGFRIPSIRFLGESYVRAPIAEQLARLAPVPGYAAPGGWAGLPYGPAGAGIFFTEGTPDIANWTRSGVIAADLMGEVHTARGTSVRAGAGTRLHRLETYERTRAHLAGSSPNYARFFPRSTNGYVDVRIAGEDELYLTLGLRFDAFRSGLRFQRDRLDYLAPVLDAGWQFALTPRLAFTLPLPGTAGRTAFRLNYGRLAQPPDFRFLLDRTIGDSLRTDIQLQGNPEMSFERGRAYEIGISQLLGRSVGVALTLFRKELQELASGALQTGSLGVPQYSTADFGTVKGMELTLRAELSSLLLRAGYALQKATGVGSGTDADSLVEGDAVMLERPLAFDQRHAIDIALLAGQSAGAAAAKWAGALTGSVRSGYPIDRRAAAGDTILPGGGGYLPWTATFNLRLSRDLGAAPGCRGCTWRLLADARNLLGRDNVLGLRRETGRVAPSLADVRRLASTVPLPAAPIPRESPLYARSIDLDGNGMIGIDEFDTARLAAALDRYDPSLYFGEPRQVRLGVEVRF